MISNERLGDFLVLSGLLIAIFLGFENFSGITLKLMNGAISLDSTYIIALVDAGIIYFGVTIRSGKTLNNYSRTEGGSRIGYFQVGMALLIGLLLSGYLLLSAIPNVPWDSVYWFDPPLNFQLIRNYFGYNLFVSLILVLVLFMILSSTKLERVQDQAKKRTSRHSNQK